MSKAISIVLADKHQLVRHGIRAILKQDDCLQVVAEAASGPALKSLCEQHQPDLILLDLSTPNCPPDDFLLTIPHLCPSSKIVILTASEESYYSPQIVSLKAHGYILKDEPEEVLIQALHTITKGERWFSYGVMEQLMRQQTEQLKLKEQEREILTLMAQGLSNADIAKELALAEQTVRNKVSHLYGTIGVRSRGEAMVWAKENGLG